MNHLLLFSVFQSRKLKILHMKTEKQKELRIAKGSSFY